MTYKNALEYIHQIPRFVRPLGNANLEKLLNVLGNPHKNLKYIHIAGTNGKGSTAAMLAQILKHSGYRVGLFTSPFIEVFNERIQINNRNILDDELAKYTELVKNAMENNDAQISEFAFICVIAFLYFRDNDCDYVVLETGMGGRLDATNIIEKSEVSVLTSISLDHMQFLGNTIEEIALEKCGIIKKGGTVVSYPNTEVVDIIKSQAQKMNATLNFSKEPIPTDTGFVYNGKEYKLSLKGAFQTYNAAVALEAVFALQNKGVSIAEKAVEEGFKNVKWPVRFEFLRDNLVVDGGHNIDGILALKKSLIETNKKIILVIAMMEDKSCRECVEYISDIADYVITTQIDMPRCINADELIKFSRVDGRCIKNPVEAVNTALEMADKDSIVCVCGSLYLAGIIRKVFK